MRGNGFDSRRACQCTVMRLERSRTVYAMKRVRFPYGALCTLCRCDSDGSWARLKSERCWFDSNRRHSWARGAVGSAREWHSRGRRFDPDRVHSKSESKLKSKLKLCACRLTVKRRHDSPKPKVRFLPRALSWVCSSRGERSLRMREVEGSNPSRSTSFVGPWGTAVAAETDLSSTRDHNGCGPGRPMGKIPVLHSGDGGSIPLRSTLHAAVA